MTVPPRPFALLGLALSLAVGACAGRGAPRALDPSATVAARSCPPSTLPTLAFRSSFWLNLHNFLHKEAKRREGIANESPGGLASPAAAAERARALTADETAAWGRALDYYVAHMLRRGNRMLEDSIVVRVNNRLADAAGDDLAGTPVDPELRRHLERAAPVYRAVWWPGHHRRNVDWIETMEWFVSRYGECVFDRAARAFAAEWPADPIRVDASVYASWFGAYSTTVNGPHVTMSSNAVGNLELHGLEGVLHEATHAARLMVTVDSLLAAESDRQGINVSNRLGHLVLFYTVGALVEEAVPPHVPYAERFGIWTQGPLAARFHDALARQWRPYLEGRRTLAEAAAALVNAVGAGDAANSP